MISLGRPAAAGTVVALVVGVVGTSNKSLAPLNTMADPPLPRERAWILHTSIEQQVEPRIVERKPNLRPFIDRELCRAALATANSRDPRDYRVSAYSDEATWFEFVRTDGKRFIYGCYVELGEVRVQLPELQRWNENSRWFYTLLMDGRVQIEYWLKPSAKERERMQKLGMETRDELLERQTFTKRQLADR